MAKMRCLNKIEANFWRQENFLPLVFEFEGFCNAIALKESLIGLAEKYPALRAIVNHCIDCSQSYSFDVSEGNVPEFVIINGNRETAIEYSKCATRATCDRKLARLAVIQSETGGYIIFTINHALFTAAHLHTYSSELFQIYTNIVTGNHANGTIEQPFPAPPEEICRRSGLEKERAALRQAPTSSDTCQKYKISQHLTIIDKDTTDSIVKTARKNNLKFANVLGGAMALVMAQRKPPGKVNPVRISVASDWLRGTDIEATATTHSVVSCPLILNVHAGADIQFVACSLQKMISSGIGAQNTDNLENLDFAMNNMGNFNINTPGDLDLIDLIIPGLYPQWHREEFRAENLPHSSYHPKCSFIFYTFNGLLRIAYLLRDDIEESVIEEFETRISALASY